VAIAAGLPVSEVSALDLDTSAVGIAWPEVAACPVLAAYAAAGLVAEAMLGYADRWPASLAKAMADAPDADEDLAALAAEREHGCCPGCARWLAAAVLSTAPLAETAELLHLRRTLTGPELASGLEHELRSWDVPTVLRAALIGRPQAVGGRLAL
jgi:hypothetical protein